MGVSVVSMTPAEQEYAHSVIREHFAEDRTEIVKQPMGSGGDGTS